MVERLGFGREEPAGKHTLPSFVEAEWWDHIDSDGLVWCKKVAESHSSDLAVDLEPKLIVPEALSP